MGDKERKASDKSRDSMTDTLETGAKNPPVPDPNMEEAHDQGSVSGVEGRFDEDGAEIVTQLSAYRFEFCTKRVGDAPAYTSKILVLCGLQPSPNSIASSYGFHVGEIVTDSYLLSPGSIDIPA